MGPCQLAEEEPPRPLINEREPAGSLSRSPEGAPEGTRPAPPAGQAPLLSLPLKTPLAVRSFFGLPLPDGHRQALSGFLDACAERAPEFRWTPADNLHLTLRFLGHVEQALAEGIADRLVQAELAAFDLRLGALGSFKRGRLARVAWIGLSAGAAEIAELAARVEAECERAGLEPEPRRFNAHLTLARSRARDGAPLPELPPPPDLDGWRAGELLLYRSRLGRGGSVYEPMRRIRLS